MDSNTISSYNSSPLALSFIILKITLGIPPGIQRILLELFRKYFPEFYHEFLKRTSFRNFYIYFPKVSLRNSSCDSFKLSFKKSFLKFFRDSTWDSFIDFFREFFWHSFSGIPAKTLLEISMMIQTSKSITNFSRSFYINFSGFPLEIYLIISSGFLPRFCCQSFLLWSFHGLLPEFL